MTTEPNSGPESGLGKLNWETIDASVENHGSIFIIRPLSNTAKDWLAKYVDQNEYQPYRDAIIVEPRYVDDLVTGMQKGGLHVSV